MAQEAFDPLLDECCRAELERLPRWKAGTGAIVPHRPAAASGFLLRSRCRVEPGYLYMPLYVRTYHDRPLLSRGFPPLPPPVGRHAPGAPPIRGDIVPEREAPLQFLRGPFLRVHQIFLRFGS